MIDQLNLDPSLMPLVRIRRLRLHPAVRRLVRETEITINDLILPLFIKHGKNLNFPIKSMPGHSQLSVDQLPKVIKEITDLEIPAILLFGIPEHKDEYGSDSYQANGIIQTAIKTIKQLVPDLLVIADVCFCEYTSHGHCGVMTEKISGQFELDNDPTLVLLAKQAVSFAEAGADIIAPSGMIDGMVKVIRHSLDTHGFSNIPIISYSTKYASGLYGPFREAAEGAPKYGDRSSYQMDPANCNQAIRESELDILEGTDMLMVKPASFYLDIIWRVKQTFPGLPLGAYQVSGEFSMIKAAAANGWIDEKRVTMESLMAIKRAGADFIITYFAKDVAKWLQE